MKLTRESFGKLADQELKEFVVPGWDVTVYIKKLSLGEVELVDRYNPESYPENGVSQIEFAARVCAIAVCDEHGELLAEGHVDFLDKAPGDKLEAVTNITSAIFDHNNLSDTEKN